MSTALILPCPRREAERACVHVLFGDSEWNKQISSPIASPPNHYIYVRQTRRKAQASQGHLHRHLITTADTDDDIALKAAKKEKKEEETEEEIAFKEKKKAEAEAMKAARERGMSDLAC